MARADRDKESLSARIQPCKLKIGSDPLDPELDVQERVFLAAGKVSLVRIRCMADQATGERERRLPCTVMNLLAAPNQGLLAPS